jgi:hypothetical protein
MRPLSAQRVEFSLSTETVPSSNLALPLQYWMPGPTKRWKVGLMWTKRSAPTRACQDDCL